MCENGLEEGEPVVDVCESFAVNRRDYRPRIVGIPCEAQQADLPAADSFEQREFIGSSHARRALQIQTTLTLRKVHVENRMQCPSWPPDSLRGRRHGQ